MSCRIGIKLKFLLRMDGHAQAYVMLDDLNELHAYYRIDDYNVKDAGKVRLSSMSGCVCWQL